MENALPALALTLFAGVATAVGSAIAFFARHTDTRFLATALGFSAGVMIYVSFADLYPLAGESLSPIVGESSVDVWVTGAFFAGFLLTAFIDRLVPMGDNPHEQHLPSDIDRKELQRLLQAGTFTAIAIAVHNFPEGLATFFAAVEDLRVGVPVALAVALHNIPEGIAVSIPIYYATGNRRLAFGLSALSGLAEPLGALLAWLLLQNVWSPLIEGAILAGVAGMMVFISLDVLLPSAETYGNHHAITYSVAAGMAIMAISLLLI